MMNNYFNEEEAAKKWCPHSEGEGPINGYCLASKCMMWQFLTQVDVDHDVIATEIPKSDKPIGRCGLVK